MANVNSPFGLAMSRSQIGHLSGAVKHYYIPATNDKDLFVGDMIVKTGTSNTADFMGHAAGAMPAVAQAAATGAVTGVIVGFLPGDAADKSGVLKAGVEGIALVIDDLSAKFNIQANGTVTADMIGQNANLSLTVAGNEYAGISGMQLEVATAGSGSASGSDSTPPQLKILGLADYENNALGDNAVLEVMINNSTEAHNTAGI